MRFATGLETMVGNRVMAAPPVRAASRSTAARTLGTRNASWTNQVSRTSPRRDCSATRTGEGAGGGRVACGGAAGGGGSVVCGSVVCGSVVCGSVVCGSAPGTQYSQSGGGDGHSGGALHPAGGT